MVKAIWFDMDGTFVNFYGVEGWLAMIRAENAEPYKVAAPLFNMQSFARVLNRLQREGYEIGIISWLARGGSAEYGEQVARAKREWLAKHLASVHFDHIDIVEWGTPKEMNRNGILFDDEIQNRENWKGQAFGVENIIEVLKRI
jgi:5'(3')-deoxyribonucleotidase